MGPRAITLAWSYPGTGWSRGRAGLPPR